MHTLDFFLKKNTISRQVSDRSGHLARNPVQVAVGCHNPDGRWVCHGGGLQTLLPLPMAERKAVVARWLPFPRPPGDNGCVHHITD